MARLRLGCDSTSEDDDAGGLDDRPRRDHLGIALAALLLAAGALPAETCRVGRAGSDSNPGAQAQPWATLQHAADTVGPGDTVLVHVGGYAGFHLTTSGTAALPIVFRAAPGEVVSITADNPVTPDGINLEGASHVTLEGFRVNSHARRHPRRALSRGEFDFRTCVDLTLTSCNRIS